MHPCSPNGRRIGPSASAGTRTLGLGVFAAWHYGVPGKYLYLLYDRVFRHGSALTNAAMKATVDVYAHLPFLVLPTFYVITGTIKGQTVSQAVEQLQAEWFEASTKSALFWTPICFLNFRLIPQHSRILFISTGSFLHKMWLSYLSNKARHAERLCKRP